MKQLFLIALLCMSSLAMAKEYTIEDIPNTKLNCEECYVSNPDNVFSPSAVTKLNELIKNIETTSSVEVAIVAVQSIGREDYTDFANKLFNYWKIGKSKKDNGLLILFVMDQRAVKIETGYGVEGVLPDAICKRLLTTVMFPLFKQNDFDGGMIATVQQIQAILNNESAIAEVWDNSSNNSMNWTVLLTIYAIIAIAITLLFIIITNNAFKRIDHTANNVAYEKARNIFKPALALGICFPVPLLLFAFWIKRRMNAFRKRPIKCSHCAKEMTLLSEQEEDEYLKKQQIEEERIKSVDYDVWLCKSCFNKVELAYHAFSTKYTICPQCHSRTYTLKGDEITRHASSLHAGSGEKTYECSYCSYKKIVPYVIPMIIIAGAAGKGGGFGGGGIGGSWGGGMSGGGGAGGRF